MFLMVMCFGYVMMRMFMCWAMVSRGGMMSREDTVGMGGMMMHSMWVPVTVMLLFVVMMSVHFYR
jgi:hypothetical protein